MKFLYLLFVTLVFSVVGCSIFPRQQSTVTKTDAQDANTVTSELQRTGEWMKGKKQEEAASNNSDFQNDETKTSNHNVNPTVVESRSIEPERKQKSDKEKARDFFHKGVNLVIGSSKPVTSDLRLAVTEFEKVISLDPGAKAAYLNLGLTYFHLGKIDKAIEYLEHLKAEENDPFYEKAVYNLGVLYSVKGDSEKAYQNFLLLKEKDDSQILSRLGELYFERGHLDEAEMAFKKAIDSDVNDPSGYFNLGMLLMQQGLEKASVAKKAFKKTISLSPDHVDASFYLGVTYLLSGEMEKATKMFNRVTKLAVDYAEAYFNLGLIFYTKGDLSNAIMYFTLAKSYNYPEAAIALAKIYLEQNNEESSLGVLLTLIRNFPKNGNGHYALGVIYQSMDRYVEAMKAYETAVELSPENTYALSNLAVVYRNLGKLDKAIETNHKLIKMDSDSKIAHKNMGIIFDLYLGNYNVAKYHYNEYLRIGPEKKDRVDAWLKEIERR